MQFRFLVLGMFVLFLLFCPGCGGSAECEDDGDCNIQNGEYCDPSSTCRCYWWEGRLVTFYVNDSCSSDLTLESCLAAVQSAIEYWNSPECSDMLIVFGGTSPLSDVGYDEENPEGNINLIVWRESSWDNDPRAMALSTATYDNSNGMTLDYDILMNGFELEFSESDVEDFLIEEFGHIIGVRDLESLCAKFPTGEPCPCSDELP